MLSSTPDHVAAAVPDIGASLPRWVDTLGGVVLWDFHNPARFHGATLGFHGGTKLELLAPSEADATAGSTGGPQGFVEAFLDRFGPRVHHVTLKVPDLLVAAEQLRSAGVEPVDVDTSDDDWHEMFVPPSVVGGCIVQVAATDLADGEFALKEAGATLPDLPTDGPVLHGPTLTHTDLAAAARVWELLGATVDGDGPDAVVARWEGSSLDVRVERGARADALGLRFSGTSPRPSDAVLGPAVVAAP